MSTEPQKKKKRRVQADAAATSDVQPDKVAPEPDARVEKEAADVAKKNDAAGAATAPDGSPSPLTRYIPIAFAVLGALMIVVYGRSFLDASIGVLAAVGVVMLLAIFALWNSVRMLTGEMPVPEELAAAELRGTVPRAEKKRSILRALKDLENEHALGKIDDEDFKIVAGRYREEAKNLLRELDTEVAAYLPKAEALIQKHLAQKGLTQEASPYREAGRASRAEGGGDGAPGASHAETLDEPPLNPFAVDSNFAVRPMTAAESAMADEGVRLVEAVAAGEKAVCASCKTINDTDAKFCKSCGTTMKKEEATDAT
jgi:ribosomal protein L40E